jgi:hypothetical protein
MAKTKEPTRDPRAVELDRIEYDLHKLRKELSERRRQIDKLMDYTGQLLFFIDEVVRDY